MLGLTRTHFSRTAVCTATFGVLLISVAAFFVWVEPASAQAFEQLGAATKLPKTDLITIIARVIRIFLSVLGIIFTLLVIYAGYLYMTSGGEPAKTAKAKDIIKQAIIGLVIIMASYTITTFVINALLRATGGQVVSRPAIEKYHEPLAGALGAGIIESHYPPRNALDIPRNTKIFVTFKEPMDETTLKQENGWLNANHIWIFETNKGKDQKLAPDAVIVTASDDKKVFVFDPVELLGNPTTDTNYTVSLQPGIRKQDGKNAFVGTHASGYGWTFEVSTVVDLTPPKVLSVIPQNNASEPRNVSVEVTFNEAMDPVSSTGKYIVGENPLFTNLSILNSLNADATNVQGTFTISNGYRTVGFTSTNACSEDPCGDTIYCLPENGTFNVQARAATINTAEIPQALVAGTSYDGLTDAAGNSLDGDGNGIACGSAANNQTPQLKAQLGAEPNGDLNCPAGIVHDNYEWNFTTTGQINDTVPQVTALVPGFDGAEIDPNTDVTIEFNTLLLGSSVTSRTASLWPDPLYSMWFVPLKTDNDTTRTSTLSITHPAFINNAEGGHAYYPVLTQGIKSAYQICMYPSLVGNSQCNGADADRPYCCNGVASATVCRTQNDGGNLPGNIP